MVQQNSYTCLSEDFNKPLKYLIITAINLEILREEKKKQNPKIHR